jgi:hypothetical protein
VTGGLTVAISSVILTKKINLCLFLSLHNHKSGKRQLMFSNFCDQTFHLLLILEKSVT